MKTRILLVAIAIALSALPLTARDDKKAPEPLKPPTEVEIKGWLKKLEEPTRAASDPRDGPPDGPWPTFGYRWHSKEIGELKGAGEAAVPPLLAFLGDKTKPGQARAHAALILMDRLVGTKVKADPKIIAVINAALKENSPALRYGVLSRFTIYGLAWNRTHWELVKRNAARSKAQNLPATEWDAADYLKRVPPPEERSFAPEVMTSFLPQVIEALADEHPEIAVLAADTINSFGRPKQGVTELLAALKRKEIEVRVRAAVALSQVGKENPDAIKAVLAMLDPEKYQRHYATLVRAVGGFGPKAKEAIPSLVRVLEDDRWWRDDPSGNVYIAACVALGSIGPDAKTAVPVILVYADRPQFSAGAVFDLFDALDGIEPEAGKEARARRKRKEELNKKIESQPTLLPPLVPPLPNRP